MKRLLSYIYPLTKTIISKYSGSLEIKWSNGKKQLNSKNANYSYGALQDILKFGIEKIELSKVNSILILGLGGGSVVETLRSDFNYTNKIEAVEIDPIIIDLAETEFGISENKNLNIHCIDAFNFVKTNTTKFDTIIVDLYIDLAVPDKFLTIEFWEAILKCKSSKGYIIFNASVVTNKSTSNLNPIISFLRSNVFKISVYEKVNNTNTVIIASGL